MNLDPKFLPTLNAFLNCLSALCLVLGYGAIRARKIAGHRRLMKAAFFFSSLFLVSYVYYHSLFGSRPFPELGWIKTLYLAILVPHVLLAVVMLPMIILTFWRAHREEWTKHRKIARLTLPIWLFVSFSGVVVYLMLYQLFV